MEIPTITSSQNRQVTRVRRLLARPRECRKAGVLVADGIHLVREALEVGLPCQLLFAEVQSRDPEIAHLVESAERLRLPLYPILPHLFRAVSPVETPQGILGVFERPRHDRHELWGGPPQSHLVVAAGIQDPTNLGSIARSALAAGAVGLVCTEETVDPFHHRALRASMGASFRLPVVTGEALRPTIHKLRNQGYRTLALAPRGETDLRSLDPRVPYALLLGSEGAGLAADIESECEHRVRIPIAPAVESLGVAAAAAVALFWLRLTPPASPDGSTLVP
ncbi:MAG: RNA methyltransferase [Candidatus Eisenbacteria bacterium]|uniref:RNA methyltransferase n=1 Tax=Eiseniibacteriota bacterium TaxID=2212470 RepID=A0A956RSX0_UNCEI|nr:RNA methyltransferase [Candidatus Eisenbacteria bacterium]